MRSALARLVLCLCLVPGSCLRTAREASSTSVGWTEEDGPPELSTEEERVRLVARTAASWWMTMQSTLKDMKYSMQLVPLGWKDAESELVLMKDVDLKPECSAKDVQTANATFDQMSDVLFKFAVNLTSYFDGDTLERGLTAMVNNKTSVRYLNPIPLGTKLLGGIWKTSQQLLEWFPKSCSNVMGLVDQGWSQVVNCVHQSAGISRSCVRCVPKFVHQMTGECRSSCYASMDAFAKQLLPSIQPALGDLLLTGIVPGDKMGALQDKITKLGVKIGELLRAYKPCMQCMRKHTGQFADCIHADPAYVAKLDRVFKVVDDAMDANFGRFADMLDKSAPMAKFDVPTTTPYAV